MFGFNQSQNSLTSSSGKLLRVIRRLAQDNPPELLAISIGNLKRFTDKIREDILLRISGLYPNLQIRPESAISHETYFENNHGYQEPAKLLLKPIRATYSSTIYDGFLTKNVKSPYVVPNRRFKSARFEVDKQKSMFDQQSKDDSSSSTQYDLGSIFKDLSPNQVNEHIKTRTKKIDTLQPEEQEKLDLALKGYAMGFEKGHESSGKSSKDSKLKKYMVFSVLVTGALIFTLSRGGLTGLIQRSTFDEVAPEDIEVVFDDVKGCDEAKKELQEIVEFLMNPEKFSKLGGKLPKGVLLSGPPGVGKTLLAKAVAGEASVPYFHAAGSEFDEVLVGQGARRVRDLFKAAKMRAPCVIFIDEMDSVGAKRTSSTLHPYANQTINQLLSEMDGFKENEGIIVLGATNRRDQLDKALLRPGRFDTNVEVTLPDVKGRQEILELYISKITHDIAIDIGFWAKKTSGFSGADLQNLVNTAAIRAAVKGEEMVGQDDFEFAFDKQTLGVDLKSRVRDMEDLKITAFHEAGHTLVSIYSKDSTPIHKVTIVAKGQSGGHTAFIPSDNQWHRTRAQLLSRMDVGMGGRAAEELIFGADKVTGGASNDLMGTTNIAEAMIKRLAMSDKLGLRYIEDEAIANGLVGDATKKQIDSEVNGLLDESYKRAMNILKTHRKELDLLAEALLNYETLDGDEVKTIIEGKSIKKKKVVRQSDVKSKKDKGKITPTPLVGGDQLVQQCKTH